MDNYKHRIDKYKNKFPEFINKINFLKAFYISYDLDYEIRYTYFNFTRDYNLENKFYIKINPDNLLPWEIVIKSLELKGESISDVEIDPQQSSSYLVRGYIYESKKQYAEALADYSRTIELDPHNILAYAYRAMSYSQNRQIQLALNDYDKLLKLNPPNYMDVYNNRGNVFASIGKNDLAMADYDKAISLDPQHTTAYLNRGDLFSAQKLYDRALQDYRWYIELNPHNRLAQKKLEHFYQHREDRINSENVKK